MAGNHIYRALVVIAGALTAGGASAATVFTANSPTISENFNGMFGDNGPTATLPDGWRIGANSGTTNYANADTFIKFFGASGSLSSSPGAYNFGAGSNLTATDRSVGFYGGPNAFPDHSVFVRLDNESGQTLTGLSLSYDFEKYRTGRATRWTLTVSTDGETWGPSIAAGGHTYVADGNSNTAVNPPSTIAKSFTLSDMDIPTGGSIYLQWRYSGVSGASAQLQALTIDNFSATAVLAPLPDVVAVPLPSAAWGGLGLLGVLGARRFRRRS